MEFLGHGGPVAIFVTGFDGVQNDGDRSAAHSFQGLTDGGQGRSRKGRDGDIVETSDRTLFGDGDAGFREGTHGAEGGQIVEGEDGGELFLLLEELFGEAIAVFKTGIGIKDIRHLEDESGIEFEFGGLREFLNATPTRRAVNEALGATNDGNAAMAALIEMFEGEAAPGFVVDHDGADAVAGNFPAYSGGGDFLFVQIGKDIDFNEEPVGDNDEAVNVAFEKHFKIAFETIALVVRIGENREITERIKSVFNATEDGRAERVGYVEEHHTDALAAAMALGR